MEVRRSLVTSGVYLALCLVRIAAQPTLIYQVAENENAGTFIGNVINDGNFRARYGNISMLRFSLLDTDFSGLFNLSSETAVITTAQEIDREGICEYHDDCTKELKIEVQPNSYFEIVIVGVDILDVNDNAPVFEESVVVRELSESSAVGTSVALSAAKDPDSASNGIQYYELVAESSVFRLEYGSEPGIENIYLILLSKLDREHKNYYTMRVFVYDAGTPRKASSMQVDIRVLDANDNGPKFENDAFEVSVPENTETGSTLIEVTANDLDEGDNGLITYAFSSRTINSFGDLFQLNSTTGSIILIDSLDYETTTSYSLTVIADDYADGSTPAQTIVTIKVLDVNDETPNIAVNDAIFLANGSISIRVTEGLPLESFVMLFSVGDNDNGLNGECVCSIKASAYFALERLNEPYYKVVTAAPVDREMNALLPFRIVCRDQGNPPLESTVNIIVTLEDVNDNAPIFSRRAYLSGLAVNSPAGTYVISVQATDNDLGINARVLYKIAEQHNDLFNITSRSGNITLARPLEFSQTVPDWVNFTVVAVDQGNTSLSSTATIAINVLDLHEQTPHFTKPVYDFLVSENRAINTFVGSVALTNVKYDSFSPFHFSLADSVRDGNQFAIDAESGYVRTRRTYDREVKDTYNLAVVATVHGSDLASTAQVTVTITDDNDHVPEFTFPSKTNNTLYVSKTTKPKQSVGRIHAKDADSGENASVRYSIFTGDPDRFFSLDATSGDIIVEMDMRSTDTQRLNLQVKASDQGSPVLTQEATLHVIVREGAEGDQLMLILGVSLGVGFVFLVLILVIVIVLRKQRKTAEKFKKVEKMLDEKMKKLDSSSSSEHNNYDGLGDLSQDSLGGEGNKHPVLVLEDQKRNSFTQLGYLGDRDSDSGCSTDLSNADSARSNGANAYTSSAHAFNGAVHGGGLRGPGSLWDTHIPEDAPYQHQVHPINRHQTYRIARPAPIVSPLARSHSASPVREEHNPLSRSYGFGNPRNRPTDTGFNFRPSMTSQLASVQNYGDYEEMRPDPSDTCRANHLHMASQINPMDNNGLAVLHSDPQLHTTRSKGAPVFPRDEWVQMKPVLSRHRSLALDEHTSKKMRTSDDEYDGHRSDTAAMATRMTPLVRKQLVGKRTKRPRSVHFSNDNDLVTERPVQSTSGHERLPRIVSGNNHSRQPSDNGSDSVTSHSDSDLTRGRVRHGVLTLGGDDVYNEHEVQV